MPACAGEPAIAAAPAAQQRQREISRASGPSPVGAVLVGLMIAGPRPVCVAAPTRQGTKGRRVLLSLKSEITNHMNHPQQSRTHPDPQVQALLAGCRDLLRKGPDPAAVRAALQAHAGAPEPPKPTPAQ